MVTMSAIVVLLTRHSHALVQVHLLVRIYVFLINKKRILFCSRLNKSFIDIVNRLRCQTQQNYSEKFSPFLKIIPKLFTVTNAFCKSAHFVPIICAKEERHITRKSAALPLTRLQQTSQKYCRICDERKSVVSRDDHRIIYGIKLFYSFLRWKFATSPQESSKAS